MTLRTKILETIKNPAELRRVKEKDLRQIADELHLSPKTIETHRLHMREKLGLKTSQELVRFAVEWVAGQTAG